MFNKWNKFKSYLTNNLGEVGGGVPGTFGGGTGNPYVDIFVAIGKAVYKFLTQPAVQLTLFVASGVNAHIKTQELKKTGQEILLTKFGTGDAMPVIYGTRRVAGTVVYMGTADYQKELFVVYAIAGHEIDSFNLETLQIDGNPVSNVQIYRDGFIASDGTTRITSSGGTGTKASGDFFGSTQTEIDNILAGTNPPNRPRMVFNCHTGSTSQAADPMLVGCLNKWTTDHKLTNIAYIACNFEYDIRGQFTGLPNLTVVVNGKKLYDPRADGSITGGTGSQRANDASTHTWSANPSLALLDYMTNDDYGKGLDPTETTGDIDLASFQTAADACDVSADTITHSSVVVEAASTTTDIVRIAAANNEDYVNFKIGSSFTVSDGVTTYIDNKRLIDKESTVLDDTGAEGVTFLKLIFEDGAVDTAITTNTTCTFTETQIKFDCHGVIDTEESILENTKALVANMRGIFTYSNGQYSIKVEGTESSVVSLDEDDIFESGLNLSLENKEAKYNKVEAEFYNAQKRYETDTTYYTGESGDDFLTDDGDEILETRIQLPFCTNQRIAYNHAKALLKRSRSQKTVSFVATPKVLKAKVGEVITITSSNMGLSSALFRITNMVINPDLNIEVTAIEYQANIYGYVTPPDESIGIIQDPVDGQRVEKPTNLQFTAKDTSTGEPAKLTWTDSTKYPSYEFRVVIKTGNTSTIPNKTRFDRRTQETFFYLDGINIDTGFTAFVSAINSLGVESDAEELAFAVTTAPVTTPDIEQGSIGGFSFTASKMYHPVDGSDTGVFETSNVYIDDSGQFSLKDKLSFDGTTLDISGNITADSLNVTGATVTGTLDASAITLNGEAIDDILTNTTTGNQGLLLFNKHTQKIQTYSDYKINTGNLPQLVLFTQRKSGDLDTGTKAGSIKFTSVHRDGSGNNLSTEQDAAGIFVDYNNRTEGFGFGSTNPSAKITFKVVQAPVTSGGSYNLVDLLTLDRHNGSQLDSSLNIDDADSNGYLHVGDTTIIDPSKAFKNILIADDTPSSTTNKLYQASGTLYWNGNQVGVGAINSVTNMVDNRVLTASGSNSVNGEANLTFDGSTLALTGSQTISGDLTVNGTTVTLNTATLDVEDKNITLNYGAGDTSASANGAGITIQDAVNSTTDATLLWNATNDEFDFSHTITLPDTGVLKIGNSDDIQLSHSGTHSYFRNYTGNLYFVNYSDDKDIVFESDNGSGGLAEYIRIDGSITETTFSKTTKVIDNFFLGAGTSTDLYMMHDGTNSHIRNNTGNLTIQNNTDDGDIIFRSDDGSGGTADYFRVDGGSSNVLFSKNLKLADATSLQIGSGNDFTASHNGTNTFVANNTGILYITQNTDDANFLLRADNGSGGVANYVVLKGSTGEVLLNHYGNNRFKTTADGVNVMNGGLYFAGTQVITSGRSIVNAGNITQSGGFTQNAGSTVNSTYIYSTVSTGQPGFVVADNASGSATRLGLLKYYGSATNVNLFGQTLGGKVALLATGTNVGGLLLGTGSTANAPVYIGTNGTLALTIDTSQNATFAGDVLLADSKIIKLGNGDDLQIYHDGSNSHIKDSGTGELKIASDTLRITNAAGTETSAKFVQDSFVELFHNNISKLKTEATGIRVEATGAHSGIRGYGTSPGVYLHDTDSTTGWHMSSNGALYFLHDTDGDGAYNSIAGYFDTGRNWNIYSGALKMGVSPLTIISSGRVLQNLEAIQLADNKELRIGTGNDLQIYHDGSNSYIDDNGTGELRLRSNEVELRDMSNEVLARFSAGGASTLFYDNSQKLATTSTGIDVTGTISSGAITSSGTFTKTFDVGNSVTISNDGTYGTSGTGRYVTLGFSGNNNGKNRIFAHNTGGDGIYIASATGRNISFRTNGSSADTARFTAAGDFQIGTTTVITSSRELIALESISLADNKELKFGSDNDLIIDHTGSHAVITNATGNIDITNNANDGDFFFKSDDGSGGVATYIQLNGGTGSVNLRHYGDVKLATTSSGIDVTGTISSGSVTSSGVVTGTGFVSSSTTGTAYTSNNSVYFRVIAPAVESGHTTKHELSMGWSSAYDRTYQAPKIDGTFDFNDEFGYNFAEGNWYFEDKLRVGNLNIGSINVIDSSRQLVNITNMTASGTATAQSLVSSNGNITLQHSGNTYDYNILGRDNTFRIVWGGGTKAYLKTGSSFHFGDYNGGSGGTTADHQDPRILTTGATTIGSYSVKGLHFATNNANRFTIGADGDVNIVSGALEVGGQSVITSARNLENIGTISSTGLVTIDANGNGNTLHIHDDSTGGQPGLIITDTGSQPTSTQTFYAKQYGSAVSVNLFGQSIGGKAFVGTEGSASGGLLIGTVTADNIWIGTNNALALTIDSSQNATFAGTISSGAITSSSTATASGGFITTSDLALRDYTTDARIHLGNLSGGASGVFAGRRLTTSGGLLYGTYWAYDAFWDDTNQNWTANRTTLGRKWKTEMGYHIDAFKVSRFDGTVSSSWDEADWDNLLTIQSATSTFATDLALTSGHAFKIGGTTVIDSSRNLTNIGTISSGAITSSGNFSAGSITGSGKLEINQAGNGTSNQPSAVAELSGQNQGGVLKALSLVNSVTAALGNGTQLAFHNANGYSPTGTLTVTQAGDTTTDSKMEFQIYRGGLQTVLRIDHDGHVDLLDGNLKINGTTVIDTSRNLVNIGTISSTGNQTTFGNLFLESNAQGFRTVAMNTSDGADNQTLALCGGGTASGARGGQIYIRGNEVTTTGGEVAIQGGRVSTGNIVFKTGTTTTERMRIDSSGNLLVGQTSALWNDSARGNVEINGSSTAILALNTGGARAGYIFQSGDDMSIVNTKNSFVRIFTNDTERFRVDNTGRVGIGTDSPSEKLQVEGNIRASGRYKVGNFDAVSSSSGKLFFGDHGDDLDVDIQGFAGGSRIYLTDGEIYMFGSSGGNSQFYFADNGHFHANNNITAYSTSVSSDLKLKDNISTIDNSLATIMALRGVNFTWKRDNKQAKGFIAQEVEEILPELVAEAPTLGTDDTHKTVDYQGVIPVLVEAIKELKAEIEELKKK